MYMYFAIAKFLVKFLSNFFGKFLVEFSSYYSSLIQVHIHESITFLNTHTHTGPKFSPLADGLITSSRGAFTSNYVAHHLTDIMTSPTSPGAPPPSHSGLSPMSGSATINSTKNLSNLSHLFRQLRPHLLQTHASSTNEARISKRSLQVQDVMYCALYTHTHVHTHTEIHIYAHKVTPCAHTHTHTHRDTYR